MFRLVERPTLMPAQSLTGSTVGPVIDTERTLPNGGRVYVTPLEGWEIVVKDPDYAGQIAMRATELGWTSPAITAVLQARIADLEHERDEALAGQPKVVSIDDARLLLEKPKTLARAK